MRGSLKLLVIVPLLGSVVTLLWPSATGPWQFERVVRAAEVRDTAGTPLAEPFLGGFNLPRPQLVDIDGDGDLDLFVQEGRNDLIYFENVGGGHFVWRSDDFQGVKVGEWFRFADLNGDGVVDLLAEEPIGYIKVYRNVGTRTAPKLVAAVDSLRDADGRPIFADPQNILNVSDIDGNGRLDLFIGRVTGTIDHFEQVSTDSAGWPRFRMFDERWEDIEIVGAMSGAPPTISDTNARRPTFRHGANTMAFGDIDGDGDLDLFWGDYFEAGLLLIENQGTPQAPNLRTTPRRFPIGAPVITSGYNAATIGDVDGDGIPDVVMGVVGGAFQPNNTSIDNLWFIRQVTRGIFTPVTSRLITMIDVGSESVPTLADVDGDGDLDLIIGSKIAPRSDNSGTVTWFENTGTTKAPAFRDRGVLPIQGEFGYAPAVADLDGDGLPDLVLGTWTDRVQWYRNHGTRTAPSWQLADTALVTITRGSNTTPTLGDIDGDGLLDMVVGEASGQLNLYRNVGSRTAPKFELVSDNFQGIDVGRRSAPHLVDMDGDGKLDLLVGNEDGLVQLWRNVGGRGAFKFVLDSSFALTSGDDDSAPAAGDLDGDGRLEILMGGAGGGIRWFVNRTPHK